MTSIKLPYVNEFYDRHGKLRRYVRRPGFKKVPLPGLPGSEQFMSVYQAAMTQGESPKPSTQHGAGTISALVTSFYGSPEWGNLSAESTRRKYRNILEGFRVAHGHRMVRDLPSEKASKIIEHIGAKTPGMANLTKAVLSKLMTYAIRVKWRRDNPFTGIPTYKGGTHRTWTEAEIAAYEKQWKVGTRERLAFDLLLYTGQRVSDVAKMQKTHMRHAGVELTQKKTKVEMSIHIHPHLQRSIDATPNDTLFLIPNKWGRQMVGDRLSKLVIAAAREAGLPDDCVPHGLRKALMRRLADTGRSTKELQAVSGHRTLKEVERYTQRADQAKLARAAIMSLETDVEQN